MINKNMFDLVVSQNATIIEAVIKLRSNKLKSVFVVDDNNKLLGVVSERDIVEGIYNKVNLEDCVLNIANTSLLTITDVDYNEDMSNFTDVVIPVIDLSGKLVGYIQPQPDFSKFDKILDKKVVILGLGYVGLTLALILAEKGFTITGFDTNNDLIESLNNKIPSFFEKGIHRYINNHVGNNLLVTNCPAKAQGDIYIITVGTPIDKVNKKPRIEHIEQAVATIAGNLKKNDLVILRSTVPLGVTRENVIPILEKFSCLKVGEDFYLAYCPERSLEGSALEELPHIPQIISGYDSASAEVAGRFFNEMTATIVDVGRLEAAELCKIMDNTFRDILFSYSNQMAEVCEKTDLDFDLLVDAVNLKYGRNFIKKPSPGVGGPCLSKDPYILIDVCRKYGIDHPLISAGREVNEWAPKKILAKSEKILKTMSKSIHGAKIFIVGFAFKGFPETSDMRDSTTLLFLEELMKHATNIHGYDPVVPEQDIRNLGINFVDLQHGFDGADAVFVMNNHKSYEDWNTTALLESTARPCLFYDAWRLFDRKEISSVSGIIYSGVGCA